MSAESDSFPAPEPEPTPALLLAQALEACIQAERRERGSAGQIIGRQPAWARSELRRLVALADSLDAAAANGVMSDEFRVAARARLMRRIAPELGPADLEVIGQNGHAPTNTTWLTPMPSRNGHHPRRQRRIRWLRRGGLGGLLAAALIAAATLTASASALPGEPLYGIKQAREEIGVRLAPDEDARTLALLNQADARLEETTRLLQEGRTEEAAQATQRYDVALDKATTTYVVTIAGAPSDPTTDTIQSRLSQQQEQLQLLLSSAPEPAQADLHEALAVTERSRELMGQSKPDTRVTRQRQPVAAPTSAAVVEPTSAPTQATPTTEATVAPTPVPIVAEVADPHDDSRRGDDQRQAKQEDPTAGVARAQSQTTSAQSVRSDSGRRQGSRGDTGQAAVQPVPTVAPGSNSGDDNGNDQIEQAKGDDGRATPPTVAGTGAGGAGQSQNQGQSSGRDHVADPPAATPAPVVAQRPPQSQPDSEPQAGGDGAGGNGRGDGNGRASTPPSVPNPGVAQTGQQQSAAAGSDGRDSSQRDGGQRPATPAPAAPVPQPTPAPPPSTSVPTPTAQPTANSSSNTDRRGSGGQNGGSHSGGQGGGGGPGADAQPPAGNSSSQSNSSSGSSRSSGSNDHGGGSSRSGH